MKSNDSVCIFCCKPSEENHHPAGRANEKDLTAPLCKDCHSEQTRLQRVAEVDLSHSEKPFLLKLQAFLKGVGIFLISLGEKLVELAKSLGAAVRFFDFYFPAWRAEMQNIGL